MAHNPGQVNMMTKKPSYEELEQRVKEFERELEQYKLKQKIFAEKKERYRDILENIEDSYLEVDLEGNFINFSNSFCKLLGYSKEELRGRNSQEFLDTANAEKIYHIFKKAYKTRKQLYKVSWEYIRKDGAKRWAEASVSLVNDDNGNPIGFRGMGRDVTDLKRAEAELLVVKNQWESTFDAVPDLIAIIDKNHQIVKANKAMADRLGVDTESMIGLTCYEAVHGTKEPLALCPHSQLLVDRMEHSEEIFEDRLGGSFLVSVTPIYFHDGQLYSIHVARDITEHMQMENALRESEQRFRFLFQSTLDCVVILDRELNYIYANHSADDYLGLIDDTIQGKNIKEALASFPEFRDLWIKRLEKFFKTEEPRWTEDHINMGTEIAWSESSLSAIRDASGKIVAAGIIYRDITKRKQMQAQQEQLISDLKNALDEVKKLSGMLPICSHCKKIRDDKGYWNQIESYIRDHSEAEFSHSICHECAKKYYPDMDLYND